MPEPGLLVKLVHAIPTEQNRRKDRMTTTVSSGISTDDVYFLTYLGDKEITGAGTSLSPAELELLVLIDGKAKVGQIQSSATNLQPQLVIEMLGKLLARGLIAPQEIDLGSFLDSPPAAESGTAIPNDGAIARGVASLQQNGYIVRIARRAPSERMLTKSQKINVVVVEDDEPLARLMQVALTDAGFVVHIAANRAEIVQALRRPPLPELILLDVMLPDADGFHVLGKLREHPVLKDVPVIMVTGKATRESVLKGLQRGANGYITKPFKVPVLCTAVRAVLGLDTDGHDAAASELWDIES